VTHFDSPGEPLSLIYFEWLLTGRSALWPFQRLEQAMRHAADDEGKAVIPASRSAAADPEQADDFVRVPQLPVLAELDVENGEELLDDASDKTEEL